MRLDVGRFAVAVATVWAIAGLVCAFVFKTAPAAYAAGANFLLHSDMYRGDRTVGWGELLVAVLVWWVLVAVLAGASAALYNRLIGAGLESPARGAARVAAKA